MHKLAVFLMFFSLMPVSLYGMGSIDADKVNAFHALIKNGAYNDACEMLEEYPDIDCYAGKDSNIALHVAARAEKEEMVALLLNHSKKSFLLEARTKMGDTPLLLAAKGGKRSKKSGDEDRCVKIMAQLIAAGANINTHALNGWGALHYVADTGNLEGVRLLLMAGAEHRTKWENCNTPLGNISGDVLYFHHTFFPHNEIRTLLQNFQGPALRDETDSVK